MFSRALNLEKRGSKDAAPGWPSAAADTAPAPAFDSAGASRSSMRSINRSSSAARASSAANSAIVRFRDLSEGGLLWCNGCFNISKTSCASWKLATGSRYSGDAVVEISLLSNSCRSLESSDIFCLLATPAPIAGVCGSADSGVKGWGVVADAGARLLFGACDCLLVTLGSGEVANMVSSACSESSVGWSTVVNTFGA